MCQIFILTVYTGASSSIYGTGGKETMEAAPHPKCIPALRISRRPHTFCKHFNHLIPVLYLCWIHPCELFMSPLPVT